MAQRVICLEGFEVTYLACCNAGFCWFWYSQNDNKGSCFVSANQIKSCMMKRGIQLFTHGRNKHVTLVTL